MNKRFLLLLLYSLFTQNNLNAHGFHGCTPVITKKGAIHLHEIQNRVSKNQTLRVLTYNTPHDQCCIERRVHTANEGETNCYCRIQFDNNRNNDIVCTPSQEFYLLSKKQLTPAYKLKKGHRLLSQHNQAVEIQQISFIEKPLKIYSIQVNDNHNFFVGNHTILTHNMMIPAAVSVGIGTSFGSGAAAGGAAGSYFGPITLCGGIVVGGVLGILYHTFFGSNKADSYQAEYDITQMRAYFAQNNQQKGQSSQGRNKQTPSGPIMPPEDPDNKNTPNKPLHILDEIKKRNGSPMKGYKGGREFYNKQNKLPEGIRYKEYDVNPKISGQSRGTERLVIGDDGSAWYTNDHYETFTKIG